MGALLGLLFAAASAAEPDLGWMVGHWVGQSGESVYEEHWEPALGGVMLGTFRMVRGDQPVFYELITVGPHGEGVAMRIKHFTPDLVGWEPRKKATDFVLVDATADRATFHFAKEDEWLVYFRMGDQLFVTLTDGEPPAPPIATFAFTLR